MTARPGMMHAGAAPIGGNDANTLALWQFKGTDGDQAGTVDDDSSIGGSNHDLTLQGNAQCDTNSPGPPTGFTGSAIFDGTGDYCSAPSHTDFDIGTGAFTIDYWYYRNGTQNAYAGIISGSQSANNGWINDHNNPATSMRFMNVGTVIINFTTLPTNQTWTHIAWVRSSGTLKLYYDGVEKASATSSHNLAEVNGLVIGRNQNDVDNYYFKGNLAEIRISNIARWTTGFTPPAGHYTT